MKLCKDKDNVYKIMLYIIDIYLLLDSKYLSNYKE